MAKELQNHGQSNRITRAAVPVQRSFLQRKCDCGQHTNSGDECAECGKNKLSLQRGNRDSLTSDSFEVPPIVHEVLRSPGQSLDPSTRGVMEPRFGHDFSRVRVHTDTAAAESARTVSAQAYTFGQDVVFGAGQFAPATNAGRHLLAHELMHVVQQGSIDHGGSVSGIAPAQSAAEHAAESAATAVTSGGTASELVTPESMPVAQHLGARKFGVPGGHVRGAVANTLALSGMIARQQADKGWSDAPPKGLNETVTTVDEKGIVTPGKSTSKGVWRIPIQDFSKHGLQQGDKGPAASESSANRAVVLIPNTLSVAAPAEGKDVAVDVLLHFHGYGIGYRELKPGKKDYAKVLAPAQLRDVELYQMEQQLISHVKASNRLVIAVLPQGSETSGFGDIGSQHEAYLKDVFGKLVPRYLPQGAIPGRVIVSGHSGGGPAAMRVANQGATAGKRTDVLLFDAINSKCTQKEAVTKDGEEVLERDGTPRMKCTKCESKEFGTVTQWVTETINAQVKGLKGLTESQQVAQLQTNGTRFRGLTSGSLKTTTCSYGFWYNKVKQHIEATIKKLAVTQPVRDEFSKNYKVEEAQGLAGFKKSSEPHERVMGQGNLEAALKD